MTAFDTSRFPADTWTLGFPRLGFPGLGFFRALLPAEK